MIGAGSVTSTGLYTSPTNAGGVVRVVASYGGKADTATISFSAAGVVARGVPYGAYQQLSRAGTVVPPFSLTDDAYGPSQVAPRIAAARTGGYTLLLSFPGGAHEKYITDGQFDYGRWRDTLALFDKATIRDAIAAGVAEGIVVGHIVMDEPAHASWGGNVTKATVDQMCRDVKGVFPTLPTGPVHRPDLLQPDSVYRSCDFLLMQYGHPNGDIRWFREKGRAFATKSRIAEAYALNILDGGIRRKPSDPPCDPETTGGPGTAFGGALTCAMSDEQIREWGLYLGPLGCVFGMWRYEKAFIERADNQAAFRAVTDSLSKLPRKPCVRQ